MRCLRCSLLHSPLVAGLLTVGHDLGCQSEVLLRLDDGERVSKTLVLDDRRVTHPLILAEDAIGKHMTSPANF